MKKLFQICLLFWLATTAVAQESADANSIESLTHLRLGKFECAEEISRK